MAEVEYAGSFNSVAKLWCCVVVWVVSVGTTTTSAVTLSKIYQPSFFSSHPATFSLLRDTSFHYHSIQSSAIIFKPQICIHHHTPNQTPMTPRLTPDSSAPRPKCKDAKNAPSAHAQASSPLKTRESTCVYQPQTLPSTSASLTCSSTL